MLDFLLENVWFLDEHPRFRESVRDKLTEFVVVHGLEFANEYYKKLFPDGLPLVPLSVLHF